MLMALALCDHVREGAPGNEVKKASFPCATLKWGDRFTHVGVDSCESPGNEGGTGCKRYAVLGSCVSATGKDRVFPQSSVEREDEALSYTAPMGSVSWWRGE